MSEKSTLLDGFQRCLKRPIVTSETRTSVTANAAGRNMRVRYEFSHGSLNKRP